jgi:hypothetical protein
VSDVFLFLWDGRVLVRREGEPSRLASTAEIDAWRADQEACWGCGDLP